MHRLVHGGMTGPGAWIPDFNRVIESYLRLHTILSVLFLSDKEFRQTIRYFESRVLTRARTRFLFNRQDHLFNSRGVQKSQFFL